MSKKKKQKYYAIKEGKGVKNKIVRTWSECKELLLGYPSIYKTFYTEEEAIKFLGVNVNIFLYKKWKIIMYNN